MTTQRGALGGQSSSSRAIQFSAKAFLFQQSNQDPLFFLSLFWPILCVKNKILLRLALFNSNRNPTAIYILCSFHVVARCLDFFLPTVAQIYLHLFKKRNILFINLCGTLQWKGDGILNLFFCFEEENYDATTLSKTFFFYIFLPLPAVLLLSFQSPCCRFFLLLRRSFYPIYHQHTRVIQKPPKEREKKQSHLYLQKPSSAFLHSKFKKRQT